MKDLDQAFVFPFRDPRWFSKFIIAGLFMLLALLGIGFFILAGYFIRVAQRAMRREPAGLPEWSDVGVLFVTGFKFSVAFFIYILPIIFLMVPLIVLGIAAEVRPDEDLLQVATAIYTFGFMLLILPYSFALTLAQPIIIYRFAMNERISDALDVAQIVGAFKYHWQSTLIVALLALGIQSLASVGIVFFIVGVAFTIFYAYLVSSHLAGMLYLDHTAAG